MKKKLFLLIFLILSAILFGGVQVHAAGEEGASSLDEYYQEQMETSGANDLWGELPGDTQNMNSLRSGVMPGASPTFM